MSKLTDVDFESVRGIQLHSGDADLRAGGPPVPTVVFDIDFEAYGLLRFAVAVEDAMRLATGIVEKSKEAVAEYKKRHVES